MASRQELLGSIRSDMKLSKDFFLKVYGYELTWSGFADIALGRLETLGCSNARGYYTSIVTEYEEKHEKEMVEVAKWYRKQLEKERGKQSRVRQRETEQQKNKLQLLRRNCELIEQQLRLLKQKKESTG